MKSTTCFLALCLGLSGFSTFVNAQQPVSQPAAEAAVPRLINFSGKAKDVQGKVISGIAGVTFAIYKDQDGGAPLFLETQNVQADAAGNYIAQLGATLPAGLPLELFSTREARWLGIRINAGEEQPRVLLVSVPYALKAADADTVGGLPASAFVLATPLTSAGASVPSSTTTSQSIAPPPSGAVTGTGTVGYVPLWDSTSDIVNSVLFQSGTGSTAKLGIGTATPSTTLDVKGTGTIRGVLSLPATGTATATKGYVSQPLSLVASAFNSTSSAASSEYFNWQSEPVGNNTSTPSASLNLLFGAGATKPVETGLRIAANGQITFATGQVFPGTGSGTITGVTAGTDLTGGGTSGSITLNLDTTKVPQLAAANTFTGNQTVNGNVSATGVVTGSSFQIGSNLFGFGSYANRNAFLGFAGNPATTGTNNTASGVGALAQNTQGYDNTAVGVGALESNSSGFNNTAVGINTLFNNTGGTYNYAAGYNALYSNNVGGFDTASGANTLMSNTSGLYNTADGHAALTANTTGNYNTAIGDSALFGNTTGSQNTAVGAGAGYTDSSYIPGSNSTFLGAFAFPGLEGLNNATAVGAGAIVSASNALILGSTYSNAVTVGIGTQAPYNDYALDVETIKSNGIINGGVVVNANGGNLYLGMTNTTHKFRVDTNGVTYADGGFQSSGADFAESVAVRGQRSEYEPGDVLEIDRTARRHLALSHRPYATLVAGIYSTKPGLLATPHTIDDPIVKSAEVPLAVVGIVPCKVTTENGPIQPGDLLVTSSRAGFAMKGTDRRRLVGAVVGKALEPLPHGTGMIQVLVTLQ